jgi:hypothetical protein
MCVQYLKQTEFLDIFKVSGLFHFFEYHKKTSTFMTLFDILRFSRLIEFFFFLNLFRFGDVNLFTFLAYFPQKGK